MRIFLLKKLAPVLLLFFLTLNVRSQYVITGNVNASSYSCASFSGYTTIYIGDGTTSTSLSMNSTLDLYNSCSLGAILFVVRNQAVIDFSPGNDRLILPLGSSIIIEPGGNLIGGNGSNCSASERIYIGADLIASCNGGAGADFTFAQLVANGGYSPINVTASPSVLCASGTSSITATASPASGATYNWYTVASGGTSVYTGNPYITDAISTSTTYYVEASYASPVYTTVRKSVTVTVNTASSITLTSGTQSPTVCSGTAITNTVYTFAGSATNASVSGLPAGLFSAVNVGAKTVTISGTPTASGTYTITTSGHTAPCTAATISGTVTINAVSSISLTSGVQSPTICEGTAITNTVYTFAGSATNASVSGLPAGLSSSVNVGAKTVTISGTPTASGTYTITTSGHIAPCTASTISGTITMNPASSIALTSGVQSPTVCSGTAITNTVYTFAGSATNASVSGLPAGLFSAVNVGAKTVTISGTPTASGTYTITTSGHTAPCTAATISGTITMNPASSIALTSGVQSPTLCEGTAITNTVYTFAGSATNASVSGLPAGLSSAVNVGAKTVTISGTPTASGTYTITTSGHTAPCIAATISGTVTVNASPNNVINGFSATTICVGGSPQLTFNAEASSFSTPYSITYRNDATLLQYTVAIPSSSAYSFTPADNPISNTGYTLVSISNASCTTTTAGIVDSGANLIVRPIPTATISGTTSVCVGGASPSITFINPQTVAIAITYNINGGANQTVNVAGNSSSNVAAATSIAGTFVYNLVSVVYQSTPNCSNTVSGSATVTVNPNPTASVGSALSAICQNGTSAAMGGSVGGGATGGTWSGGSGTWTNATNPSTATYTASAGESGSIILTLTTNGGSCGITTATKTITVNSLPITPTIGTLVQPTCVVSTGSVDLSGLPASGTWTINPGGQTGTGTTTTISGLAVGTYNFTVSNGICTSLASANVVINPVITNTWTTSWSNGTPTALHAIVFNGNFSSTADLEACSCQVNTGRNVVINSGHTLKVTNQVAVLGTGSLTFENNASLVQVNDAAVNTGNINYKRHTTPVRRYDFTYWSSPVVGQTLYNLSPNTLGNKYYGYNPNTGWVVYYNGAATMVAANGYLIRAPETFSITTATVDTNPVFIGVPNNGVVSLSLAGNKSCLLGNPYPSAIDADTFLNVNSTVLEGTLYFWTHNTPPSASVTGDAIYNYTSDDYASYNKTGSVGTAASTGGVTPNGKIAAGQGFFAPTTVSGGTLVFNNSMRITGNNSQFFKLSATTKSATTVAIADKNRVWLNLSNKEGAFKQTLIGYVTGATNNYDSGFDGVTYDGNQYVDFYSVNQGMNLSIQGRALPFVEKDSVVLGYKSTIKGDFQISIDHMDGILSSQNVFLEDKNLKIFHDLKKTAYLFTTEKGVFNNRFVLYYVDKTTLGQVNDMVLVSVNNNEINVSSEEDLISKISIYDISGTIIYQKEEIGANNYTIQHLNLTPQVLIANVVLANGKATSTKIVY